MDKAVSTAKPKILLEGGGISLRGVSVPTLNQKLAEELFQQMGWNVNSRHQVREPGSYILLKLVELASRNTRYYVSFPILLYNNDPPKIIKAIEEWAKAKKCIFRVVKDPIGGQYLVSLPSIFPSAISIAAKD